MCFAPPVTEYVPLHSKSLSKNMARASGGANNMRPLSWEGAQTEKIISFLRLEGYWWSVFFDRQFCWSVFETGSQRRENKFLKS